MLHDDDVGGPCICLKPSSFWSSVTVGGTDQQRSDAMLKYDMVCMECALIVCSNTPRLYFGFFLPLLISTFGCNYKFCHKTLSSVTYPSKPLMLVCLLNDRHYISPLPVSLF